MAQITLDPTQNTSAATHIAQLNANFNDSYAGFMKLSLIPANAAIPPRAGKAGVITKGTAAALTLAAPTAGADDGIRIMLTSDTAAAHTLTATGLLQTGSASVNVATFAAFAGAGLTLVAYKGKWNVLAQIGITFS